MSFLLDSGGWSDCPHVSKVLAWNSGPLHPCCLCTSHVVIAAFWVKGLCRTTDVLGFFQLGSHQITGTSVSGATCDPSAKAVWASPTCWATPAPMETCSARAAAASVEHFDGQRIDGLHLHRQALGFEKLLALDAVLRVLHRGFEYELCALTPEAFGHIIE